MNDTLTAQEICQERARAGLAWIQEHGEALGLDLSRVDRESIDTRNTYRCVLAQAYGSDTTGPGWTPWHSVITLGIEAGLIPDNGYGMPARPDEDDPEGPSWAALLGFDQDWNLTDMGVDSPSAEQDLAWRVVLAPYLP